MLISLGHSCQTRFIVDLMGQAANRRMPFDFNITTRTALLRAFETDGASLRQIAAQARVFVEPREAREGIEMGGMYFWHDYPLDDAKLRLLPHWRDDMPRVSEKYAALWQRLATLARSEEPKTFFLSNSQHNLGQFAEGDDDFERRFGLGRQAFEELSAVLDGFGARNYKLLFLSRSARDLEETAGVADARLDHRFSGKLSLRPDPVILSRVFADGHAPVPSDLLGTYEGGCRELRQLADRAAIAYRVDHGGTVPDGIFTSTAAGLIAAFEGRDRVHQVSVDKGDLVFSDGTRWTRD